MKLATQQANIQGCKMPDGPHYDDIRAIVGTGQCAAGAVNLLDGPEPWNIGPGWSDLGDGRWLFTNTGGISTLSKNLNSILIPGENYTGFCTIESATTAALYFRLSGSNSELHTTIDTFEDQFNSIVIGADQTGVRAIASSDNMIVSNIQLYLSSEL